LRSRAAQLTIFVVLLLFAVNIWQATALIRHRLAITSGKKKIQQLRKDLAESRKTYELLVKERKDIEEEARIIERRFSLLRQAEANKSRWAPILVRLSELIPERLWIRDIKLDRELITIGGTTFDNEIVSRFMERLDKSEYFRDTGFNYTQKKQLDNGAVINFEVITHVSWQNMAP